MGFEPMHLRFAKTYVFDHFTTAPLVPTQNSELETHKDTNPNLTNGDRRTRMEFSTLCPSSTGANKPGFRVFAFYSPMFCRVETNEGGKG